MGGMLGIALAGGALEGRVTHLVINDMGPETGAGSQRIAAYVGNPRTFDTLTAFEQWIRAAYAPFGFQTDATWRHLAETSFRRTDAGKITVHYDPHIVDHMAHAADQNVWEAYDRIRCPTLLLRGAQSDVLSRQTAAAMTQREPKCRVVEIEGCGHAPMLNVLAQQKVVEEFLDS